MLPYSRVHNAVFCACLLLVLSFFAWSRYDVSHKVYFYGDGNLAVEMVKLILETNNWDADWYRLLHEREIPASHARLQEIPPDSTFYNMSGYFVVAAAFSKIALIFTNIPIPTLLRLFNSLLQLGILGLLFVIGHNIKKRWGGLITIALFATFPLSLLEAHYERTEVLLCFLATLTLYSCMNFWRAPLRYSITIGAAIGVSIASKISQLYLCTLPAFILFAPLFSSAAGSQDFYTKKKLLKIAPFIFIMFTAFICAIYVTVPFILQHPLLYFQQVQGLIAIQKIPDPPYVIDNFTPLKQLAFTIKYFLSTLGLPWLIIFVVGCWALVRSKTTSFTQEKKLCLLFPCLFLPIYFSQFHSFFERNFSALIGFYCLVSAAGIFYIANIFSFKNHNKSAALAGIVTLSVVLFTPLQLDSVIVNRFFHASDHLERKNFQTKLKSNFHKFWFYQVDDLLITHNEIPQKPPKIPRIYLVKDFGDKHSKDYRALLIQHNFVAVGEYRGEFYGMTPNNITIYHESPAYYYFIRTDERPVSLEKNFYATNF